MNQQSKQPSESGLLEGLITEGSRGRYRVETEIGTLWCSIRGRLRKNLFYAESSSARRSARRVEVREGDPVAIGDRVRTLPTGNGEGVIEQVIERAGAAVTRQDPDPGRRSLTTVAGVEQMIAVFAAREPAPHLRLADRFIALAEAQGAEMILCVNKADQGIEPWLRQRVEVYGALGYAVIMTSATTGEGVERLRAMLAGRVSALVGPSGVGKSSLLNALEPGLAQRVSAVSQGTGKGRHTTTGARMAPLTGGGWLADTAGIRALALDRASLANLPWLFREFRPYLGACEFNDCQHSAEPGCAVRAAVGEGAIDAQRYDSYLRLRGAAPAEAHAGPFEMDATEETEETEARHARDG